MGDWTFFSNYGHVLVCLARDGRARLRDVASEVGITERAVQKIVKDMQSEGFIEVRKQGRCNRYRVNRRKVLRHPLQSHCTVGKLLALIAERGRPAEPERPVEKVERAAAPEPPAVAAPATPPQPPPEAKARPTPVPEPEARPEPEPQPTPRTEPEPGQKSTSKTERKKDPIDVEQQGNLF